MVIWYVAYSFCILASSVWEGCVKYVLGLYIFLNFATPDGSTPSLHDSVILILLVCITNFNGISTQFRTFKSLFCVYILRGTKFSALA